MTKREWLEGLARTIRDEVERMIAPLRAKLEAFEAREVPIAPASIVGATIDRAGHLILTRTDGTTLDTGPVVGRDADPDAIRQLIADAVTAGLASAVAALPPAPTVELASAPAPDPIVVQELVDAAVQRAVAALPAPRDGTSVTAADCLPLIAEEVAKAMAGVPTPKDGASVTLDDVTPVIEAEVAKAVRTLPTPEPAVSVTDAAIDAAGVLRIRMSDGSEHAAGHVVGRDADPEAVELILRQLLDTLPTPRDGRDGIATREELQQLVRESVADTVPAVVAAQVTEEIKRVPRIDYQGVWRAEQGYTKGDVVTWGGSAFIAKAEDPEGKPGESPDWQLFVKRGRDGHRDGRGA